MWVVLSAGPIAEQDHWQQFSVTSLAVPSGAVTITLLGAKVCSVLSNRDLQPGFAIQLIAVATPFIIGRVSGLFPANNS